ncbi:multisubunit potassium/proton antiporter, PhaG subunit (TC 2.A.63.1.1) [Antarctobacter heliothermus]|uniref:Multisubunit potassium/proton antiporter, PhaG subunit (TC 2.A.63.1.1) n=2 Tax=Antarctobacter heliothermus TaxID=74033 RepID=A0A239BVM1_9RHOB|nr:multisubunit potassium/proton antiporter, PhaG subunit (TC 2.A.63.1.1) [Antarctobacter heliothermus]
MLVEVLISFFLVVSGIFGLIGSLGLLKLTDTMQRLHAPTKATTLGVGGVLIASMLFMLLVKDHLSFHELMITLFLFLTAPISTLFIAQTHILMNLKRGDLPDTGREHSWSIYDDPPDQAPVGEENAKG